MCKWSWKTSANVRFVVPDSVTALSTIQEHLGETAGSVPDHHILHICNITSICKKSAYYNKVSHTNLLVSQYI